MTDPVHPRRKGRISEILTLVNTTEKITLREFSIRVFESSYKESSGTPDVFVQGDKNLRRDMEEIFARLVLKEELPEEGAGRQPYELNGLRSRDFDFPTDPEDGIQEG